MKKVILVILDGWGVAPPSRGNAITLAKTPALNKIEAAYPCFLLQASGKTVGLPWGNEGNSEVGHLALGSGRIIFHYLPQIVNSIQDGSFFENKVLKNAASHVKTHNSSLHLMGLISSGSVHSYIDHLYGLLEFAKREKLPKVYMHIFTDGKDSPPYEGAKFIENLDQRIKSQNLGRISTVAGRVYSMDRSGDWNATKKTYYLLTRGEGNLAKNPSQYLRDAYSRGVNDAYIEPAVINESGTVDHERLISKNDAVIFFNFREDSARQLTRAFMYPGFKEFERDEIQNLLFITMVQYEDYIPASNIVFLPTDISNTLAEVLSRHDKTQLHIAETEKYAHATYFFNGIREQKFNKEERILIPSYGTPHYENYPEMGAIKITDEVIKNLLNFDFILINFANADMLSHSGSISATVRGIETIDECIARIEKELGKDTTLLITADHGHAEEMLDPRTGEKKTEHTSNPVPFYLVDKNFKDRNGNKRPLYARDISGILADVAPTVLDIMGLPVPDEMTGQSLLPVLLTS